MRVWLFACPAFFLCLMPATLPDLGSCQRALIIKPSSLGDLVHTLPSVHLLKQQFPHIEFSWLVNPEFAPLLEGNPDLAGTILFPRENFRGAHGLWNFTRWLKQLPAQLQPDIALDFQGLLRSGLTARFSRAPVRIGFSDSREGARFFHTHIIRVDPNAHAIDRSLTLPRTLGLPGPAIFPLPQGSRPASLASGADAPLLLHPFSRGTGKSLTPAQTLGLCQVLAPLSVILVGRTGLTLPPLPPNTQNLINQTTLPELIWLIRRARGVISVDSGPMHIAAALTPNVLSLHTWSDPRKVGPWHPGTTVWKAGRLMPASQLDPGICSLNSDFPDSAITQVAAWAHELPNPSMPARP